MYLMYYNEFDFFLKTYQNDMAVCKTQVFACLIISHCKQFRYHRYVCNGVRDCPAGDDETNCTTTTTRAPTTTPTVTTIKPTVCAGFLCSKISNQCIPSKYLCDGTKDCKDSGEDELCCGVNEQRCHVQAGMVLGKCIGNHVLCDGYNDCGDNSDERNCTATTTVCAMLDAMLFLEKLVLHLYLFSKFYG